MLRTITVPKVPLSFGPNPASGPIPYAVSHAKHHSHGYYPAKSASSGQAIARTSFVVSPSLNSTVVSLQKRYYAARPVPLENSNSSSYAPPDQSKYRKDPNTYDDVSAKTFNYFLIGSLAGLTAVGMKNFVVDYVTTLSASKDVLAMAKVEVDLTTIPEGTNVVLKWRGKPVMIRHRTAEEIAEANSVDLAELRHPETDVERTKDQKWLVMLGICTHLGCVPIGDAGEYGGWFCPCHGSHYDISGRIRKGPAPLNLEIPEYDFNEDKTKVVIG
ncbi:hsp70 nucleotide exchange factor fes1 [Nowakowskiella sp. JEL0407]|nr:hsp70 nucleotide exchange factor fes1 [Nowakowskiella sp. JEL0407]